MNNIKILVVDDEPPICNMVVRFLSMNNYSADSALNGKEAMKLIQTNNYHLVLTDIKMPEMDGITLMKVAKGLFPDLLFVIMSGYGTLDSAIESMKMGAINFIKKPISIIELIATIKKAEDHLLKKGVALRIKPFVDTIEKNLVLTTREANENLDLIIRYLTTELKGFGLQKLIVDNITMALYEAISNAIEHGNLELNKNLSRDNNIEVLDGILKEKHSKLKDPAFADKKIHISMSYLNSSISYKIKDEGNGFNFDKYIQQLENKVYSDNLHKGIFLIKNVVNKVSFNSNGNEITIQINVNEESSR